jgi:O-antigen ligase
VYGSAQHPLAFGAALALLMPLAIYCAQRTQQWRWRLAGVVMVLGIFATRSRTGIVMLLVIGIVYLVLRGRETRRFWPALVPLVLAIHFAVPGAIGTTWQSFFPEGGLLAQEKKNQVGSGRVATFGPVFHSEVTPNPILGEGYATRIVTPEAGADVPLAPITDDMWLSILAETGIVGAYMLGWLFVRATRRFGRAARRDHSPRGWLLVGTAAAVVAYAIGMLTYDSFAFIQVTFLLFFVLAIGVAALLTKPEEWEALAESGGQSPSPAKSLAST